MKLIVKEIDKLEPRAKEAVYWDDNLKGLGLRVSPKGKRTFFYYYRTEDQTQRKITIGAYPNTSPNDARTQAKKWLAEVQSGGDPAEKRKEKRRLRGTGTVNEMFEAYLIQKKKRRSIREVERVFRHDILPVIGKTRAELVTRGDVTELLEDIAVRSISLAHAVRRQLSAFYTWALPKLPSSFANPVTSAGRVEKLDPRERVLSDIEVSKLWCVLNNEVEPWRSALKLLLLTGQRREEVLQAEWSEFNIADAVWIIPASRAKNNQAHIVPLSPAVLVIIKAIKGERDGRVFKKGTGPTSRAAKRIREAMGSDVEPWRWHDLRRTVATGMQRLGVRLEVTEAVLNHKSGSHSGIVAVYQRHHYIEEKRAALDLWALDLERILRQNS